ncbi:hypothetical protein IHE45_08G039100 [Dioscorea alata]|uniref:Uncharacterized protein n=3 Tax=Dioscorea alata TaxID=55571 RepID=A0ACB7VIM1_DIOAL|nr:hypothetical protein IHE45_08G039100 [Dioscorea alata]KAH7673937.1 hypothetical protein IHE45_08G039100 [Dioscorea alata]KAH7673940.1 hypothetical protein IHE45_08G039100 [Dioscorea alata]
MPPSLEHPLWRDKCNASCIRQFLVKLLRLSGYEAAICTSKWQGSGKVPGGDDHEYIDVIVNGNIGGSDRLIVDIDFRSHFEIARAVESYDAILASLPVFLPKLMHSCPLTSKDVQSKHQSGSTRSCTKRNCKASVSAPGETPLQHACRGCNQSSC